MQSCAGADLSCRHSLTLRTLPNFWPRLHFHLRTWLSQCCWPGRDFVEFGSRPQPGFPRPTAKHRGSQHRSIPLFVVLGPACTLPYHRAHETHRGPPLTPIHLLKTHTSPMAEFRDPPIIPGPLNAPRTHLPLIIFLPHLSARRESALCLRPATFTSRSTVVVHAPACWAAVGGRQKSSRKASPCPSSRVGPLLGTLPGREVVGDNLDFAPVRSRQVDRARKETFVATRRPASSCCAFEAANATSYHHRVALSGSGSLSRRHSRRRN